MKSGRVSLLTLFVILAVGGLAAMVFFGSKSDSPERVTLAFMNALAKGDPKELAANTYLTDVSPADLEKKWVEACTANKYYLFQWNMKSASATNDEMGIGVVDLYGGRGEKSYSLPLIKRNGKWLVDLSGVSREVYPYLPR